MIVSRNTLIKLDRHEYLTRLTVDSWGNYGTAFNAYVLAQAVSKLKLSVEHIEILPCLCGSGSILHKTAILTMISGYSN